MTHFTGLHESPLFRNHRNKQGILIRTLRCCFVPDRGHPWIILSAQDIIYTMILPRNSDQNVDADEKRVFEQRWKMWRQV